MAKQQTKLVFLVAPPRSISTAFLRMMQARGDFQIFNEPAAALFNKTHYPHSQGFYIDQPFQTYDDIKEDIESSLQQGHVFVKEMSFSFFELLPHLAHLHQHQNVYFLFLLRNPHHCIVSYYRKIPPEYIDFMMPQLSHLVAYKALYQSYEWIKTHVQNPPFIIDAEQLLNNPQYCIDKVCQYINIPFLAQSLTWEPLGKELNGLTPWHELKKEQTTQHWHGEALKSQGFQQPTQYAVDKDNQPLFSEITSKSHQQICQDVYQDYLTYYQLMLNDAKPAHEVI